MRISDWSSDVCSSDLIRELAIDKTLKTPVNFIVHTLQEVNDGLAHGRYFFMDVARDGIALYEYDDKPLHTPKPKTPDQALAMAREYFDEWFPTASDFHGSANDAITNGKTKLAAFLKIGRAHVRTTVTTAQHFVRLTLEN